MPRKATASQVAALTAGDADGTGDSDRWYTNRRILDLARLVVDDGTGRPGRIALDPFWGPGCITDPVVGVDRKRDGFAQDWRALVEEAVGEIGAPGFLDVWLNPPYSRMDDVARKVPYEAARGLEMILLSKASTSERWFQTLAWDASRAVCFPYARVTHHPGAREDKGTPAMFSSALTYYGPTPWRFRDVFGALGKVITLR